MQYRKKPVVIEAYLYDGNELNAFRWEALLPNRNPETKLIMWDGKNGLGLYVSTLEGIMFIPVGNYIIMGVRGELYSCEPNIFNETYEECVDETYNYDGE